VSSDRDSLDIALERIAGGCLSIVYVSSGLSLALRIISQNYDVCAVIDEVRAKSAYADRVVARLRALAEDGGDPQYRHEHEAAMLGLIYALHESAPERAVSEVRLDWPECTLRARWFVGFARLIARSE